MILERLERLSDRLARYSALAGLGGLMGIAALVTIDVLGRWLFNSPIRGSADIVTLLLPVVVGAAFPSVITSRGHIAVKFLSRIAGVRGADALEAFGNGIAMAALALIAWLSADHALRLMGSGETTWVLRLPLWPTWVAFCVLLAISTAVQAIVFFRDVANFVSGNRLETSSNMAGH
ncbi:TRAP transporter small permease [Chelatococcus asaccharovorans]|uniref:TRAP transporter small permease protein n=1 Tax=Chelatococcus asaccharovorans TaxID=28210 RepID=A0A2V3TVV4_9HYPH|nr:TRAP transporter small permease [Chelatococcus asaccharovorans]MBS7705162.1 TRAP transporter small permease [Chelatococcus asaccharovorans]PXW53659.1 TRAP-type C4-dicarboxylate transport system permease small subunit [Chelatococcus asaccharovorans]CAH1653238.1 TRAP-type C4-dicarboxylate transport system permease small subunit [Chelatococcus asaccharovorans]CAH1686103.1 TRAP-type C4-dicarboxylate transport system permease small subunit [Chelatococcus asaccharovorans]